MKIVKRSEAQPHTLLHMVRPSCSEPVLTVDSVLCLTLRYEIASPLTPDTSWGEITNTDHTVTLQTRTDQSVANLVLANVRDNPPLPVVTTIPAPIRHKSRDQSIEQYQSTE